MSDAPFWDAAAEGRLVVQRCERCGSSSWPAVERCPSCGEDTLVWVDVEPEGRVWSYAVYHRLFDKSLDVTVPYAVAAVELDAGVCLPGRMVGSLDDLAVGATVDASFEPLDGALIGPVWRVRGATP